MYLVLLLPPSVDSHFVAARPRPLFRPLFPPAHGTSMALAHHRAPVASASSSRAPVRRAVAARAAPPRTTDSPAAPQPLLAGAAAVFASALLALAPPAFADLNRFEEAAVSRPPRGGPTARCRAGRAAAVGAQRGACGPHGAPPVISFTSVCTQRSSRHRLTLGSPPHVPAAPGRRVWPRLRGAVWRGGPAGAPACRVFAVSCVLLLWRPCGLCRLCGGPGCAASAFPVPSCSGCPPWQESMLVTMDAWSTRS